MTDTPAAPTTPDTDTALRTADVLWSALQDRLEPEERIGYGRLYEQMYSWMLDRAEARSTPAEALDPHRLGGLIERAIRESRRKNGLIPDGWTLVEMALAYSPETPTEPSLSPHNREADHE